MKKTIRSVVLTTAAAGTLALVPALAANAYVPTPHSMYSIQNDANCLKGTGNCVVYPKAAQLNDGRLVASFEDSEVPASGTADGQTLPIYKSDDNGTSWQKLSSVKAPAYMSKDPQYAQYTSNWTNPYLYVLPEKVGRLNKGTLVLASVVSGQDEYYVEHKQADPNWKPTNDGDRRNVAIALYSSTDRGSTWRFQNIVAKGGWQGGSAGAAFQNISQANTNSEVDPVWEPYLMAYKGQLVTYYSDENDYIGYNTTTGVAQLDPANATAKDSGGQILAHRTWDGSSASSWSAPVVDVSGTTQDMGSGKTEIGGGRPGMANVVQTTDGKWMLTYEYWGGGANVRYKMADDPLEFFKVGGDAGNEISHPGDVVDSSTLQLPQGGRGPSWGGSPVLIKTADGTLVYNAAGSSDVWVNYSGKSDGLWYQLHTGMPAGYSRNLTYDSRTGRVVILSGAWGGSNVGSGVSFGEVDLGDSAGHYYRFVNRKTGQVLGTGGHFQDDQFNGWTPSVQSEPAGSQKASTEQWHVVDRGDGGVSILQREGGRALEPWGPSLTAGTKLALWTDDKTPSIWQVDKVQGGYVRIQARTEGTFVTSTADGAATVEAATTDGSQDWKMEVVPGSVLPTR